MKRFLTILFILFSLTTFSQDTTYVATWTSDGAKSYDVLQSKDSLNWTVINTVTDTTCLLPGYTYYYRVKGNTVLSNTIKISQPVAAPIITYKGHSKHVAINYGSGIKISGTGKSDFILYDISGRLVRKSTVNSGDNFYNVPLGFYILKLDNTYKKIFVK